MTKAEIIERHGLEWYEQYKIRQKARMKERYNNDPEFRKSIKARQKERYRNDPEYREFIKNQVKEYQKERCRNDPEFRKSKRARSAARCKERYNNDPEYHNRRNKQSKARKQARYVENGRIDLVENYELAARDNFVKWEIHHRLELHPDGSVRFTVQSLLNLNLYYNRPPSELIWITYSEHRQMHGKASY